MELEEQILSLKTKEADLEAEAARIKELHARRENERQRALENKLNQLVASFSADAATVLREIEDEAVRLKLNKQISRKAIKLKSNIQKAHDVTLKRPDQKYPTTKPTVGDEVYVKGLSLSGVVTRVYDDLLEIDINGKTLRENLAGVELTAPNAGRAKKISLPEGVTLELEDNDRIDSELNVIGCTVDEALAKADKFLDRAILMSLDKVRIIHGHGTGKLRRAMAEFLSRHADVASYDQSESHGGVTSITLKCV